MAKGYISLHRQIEDNWIWFSEPFSRGQAWIDLLLIANHKENFIVKRGIRILVKRGQIGWCLDTLGNRWKWSRGKIERFMVLLEKDSQIVRQKTNITTLISIVNYEKYQTDDKANNKANDKANGQQTIKQTEANNNDNNFNNDNNKEEPILLISATAPLPKKNLEERVLLFGKSLEDYKSEYQREMLVEFFNYWREPNHSKTKMKWEFEKTWDLNLRLKNWHRRVLQKKPNNDGIKFDWEIEKNNFLKDETWAIKITSEHKIKKEDFERSIQYFIKNLELQDDYKNVFALKKHYLNHFNKHGLFVNKQLAEIKTMPTPTYGKQETLEEKLARYK